MSATTTSADLHETGLALIQTYIALLWLLEVIGDRTLRDPCGPYKCIKFRLLVSTSQNKQKVEVVILFSTEVIGEKKYAFCSP